MRTLWLAVLALSAPAMTIPPSTDPVPPHPVITGPLLPLPLPLPVPITGLIVLRIDWNKLPTGSFYPKQTKAPYVVSVQYPPLLTVLPKSFANLGFKTLMIKSQANGTLQTGNINFPTAPFSSMWRHRTLRWQGYFTGSPTDYIAIDFESSPIGGIRLLAHAGGFSNIDANKSVGSYAKGLHTFLVHGDINGAGTTYTLRIDFEQAGKTMTLYQYSVAITPGPESETTMGFDLSVSGLSQAPGTYVLGPVDAYVSTLAF